MTHTIRFTKMHGLGNDFVVINGVTQKINAAQLPVQAWADRHTGIGFDQLLLVSASNTADFHCQFFNADGSEAEQCGNGIRCLARFIIEEKLSQKTTLALETKAGIIHVKANDFKTIQANMGAPQSNIEQVELYSEILAEPITLTTLSLGNPHAIIRVESLEATPVKTLGAEMEKHIHFPQGVNVGFMEIINTKHIRLCTFERGVGETLCCGSNACAAVVAGIKYYGLAESVTVEHALGNLVVEWRGESIVMIGSAEVVFEGMISV